MNMKKYLSDMKNSGQKKAMPIISFPAARLLGLTIEETVKSGEAQAQCCAKLCSMFPAGAAFTLMDLSVEAEAFGAKVAFSAEEVPAVKGALITSFEEAEKLAVPEIGAKRTGESLRGLACLKKAVADRPVIAGIIGPFSLAGRLLDMTEIMILCFEEPETVKLVLEKATQFLIGFAKAMKAAGADGILMAEPAAGLLSPAFADEFSTPYVNRVLDEVADDDFTVIYHNCGNVIRHIPSLLNVHADVFSLGNAVDMKEMLDRFPPEIYLMGNIDPADVLCRGSAETVYAETAALLEKCGRYPNFIPSTGCDVPPVTPMENIEAFFRAVGDYYN